MEVSFLANNTYLNIKGKIKKVDEDGSIELMDCSILADKETIDSINSVNQKRNYRDCTSLEQVNDRATALLSKIYKKILCDDNTIYTYNSVEYVLDMYDIYRSEFTFSLK